MADISIALDCLSIIVLAIIFASCFVEKMKKEASSGIFLCFVLCIILSLASDAIFHAANGVGSLRLLTYAARTVHDILGYLVFIFFMLYMRESILSGMRVLTVLLSVFIAVSVGGIALSFFNLHYGFSFTVDTLGYLRTGRFDYLSSAFILCVLLTLLLAILLKTGTSITRRLFYCTFMLFPIAGVLLNAHTSLSSMTCLGTFVSAILIYTNIYLSKRHIIAEQRTALMISQINPHFTYNTLTAVASLCDTDPKKAKSLIIDFSTYLRGNLNTLSSSELISFDDELRHLKCYLKIEQERFGDHLNVVYDIQSRDFYLPALTVQPIVENAVKHGVTKKREGGTVRISTYRDQKYYYIEIKDDGVGFIAEEIPRAGRVHVGLDNVRARLKSMSGGSLSLQSMKGVGTRVLISIPIAKGGVKQ